MSGCDPTYGSNYHCRREARQGRRGPERYKRAVRNSRVRGNADVYCRIDAVRNGVLRQRYGLDGLSRQGPHVIRALWRELLPLAPKTLGFAVFTTTTTYATRSICRAMTRA